MNETERERTGHLAILHVLFTCMLLLFELFAPESGEEDNVSQSTISSVTLYPPGGSSSISGAQTSPTPATKDSQTTPSTPSKAAAPLEEGDNKETQGEEAGDPTVKDETSVKRPRGASPSQEDSDGMIASPGSPPPPTSGKRSSDNKRSSKYRRHSKKREKEEGEDSDESVDSESDSEDSSEPHSRSRLEMLRHPRRERRRRSPGNAPSGGGGDSQGKIPSLCRHFLNGKERERERERELLYNLCVCVYVNERFLVIMFI